MRLLGAVIALLLCISAAQGALVGGTGVRAWGSTGCERSRLESRRPSLRLRGGIANLAAYMLLKLGGTEDPTPDDVKRVLNSVGAEIEDELVESVCTKMKGRDIDELVEQGKQLAAESQAYLAAAGVGAGGGGGGGGVDQGEAADDEDEAKDHGKGRSASAKGKGDKEGGGKGGKKEETKEEKKEESSVGLGGGDDDGDMGFGLFD